MSDNNNTINTDIMLVYRRRSSRGDSVSAGSQRVRRSSHAVLSLCQQSSLLPVLSESVVTVHWTCSSLVRQTEQLQSTQSVHNTQLHLLSDLLIITDRDCGKQEARAG